MASLKMSVLCLKKTGHVLAACTQVGKPGGLSAPAAIVGETLALRSAINGDTLVGVEGELLKAEPLDIIEDVLLRPRLYVLVDGVPALKAGEITVNGGPGSVTVNYVDANGANIQNPAEGDAMVILERGSPPQRYSAEATLGPNLSTFTVFVAAPAGTYNVLVAAPGWPAAVKTGVILP